MERERERRGRGRGRVRVRSSARLHAHSSAGAEAGAAGAACAAAAAAERAADEARAAAAAAERAARRAREAARQAEVEDSPRVLRDKCRRLARAIKNAKHLVVYTGAGVSTAAAIPDYRGPCGVWTRLARGEAAPRVDVARAVPTYTHLALAALAREGRLRFLVSQNCDGLHLRAGTPRRRLAELHGNMFLERCPAPRCRRVYARTFDTSARTRRHAHGTRRLCHACGRELRDTIVHFGERGRAAWPLHWAGALRHAARADVVLCLGSSLKVLRRYPRLWSMQRPPQRRPQLYIVNLQWTPKDRVCALKINARCDDVMRQLARRLRLRVPRYSARRDPLRAHATPLAPPEAHTAAAAAAHRARLASSASSSCGSSASESLSPSTSPSPSPSPSPSSSSASDSEDERPLQLLATRLRPPPPPPPPPPLPPPPPPPLRPAFTSFQVKLHGIEATILLRPEHAPAPPAPAPALAPAPLSELRRFRMPKHVQRDYELEDDKECLKPLAALLKREVEVAVVAGEVKQVGAGGEARCAEAEALARRIIERAVRLCRARLYPGLHTILAPPAPPAPPPHPTPQPPAQPPPTPVECGWCWKRHKSKRCLWYPARDPLSGRVWRRVRQRRYLCACCPGGGGGGGAGGAEGAPDEPGWYGKGYRKGRRRRR